MKMLKKVVSCAMAAVLSLSMLTACGGGSSSNVSAASAFATLGKQVSAGKYYYEVECTYAVDGIVTYTSKDVFATNGERSYYEYTDEDGTYKEWEDFNYYYDLDEGDTVIYKWEKDDDEKGYVSGYLNTSIFSLNVVTGTETIDGVEYNSATVKKTSNGVENTYTLCFDKNGTLKYYIQERENKVLTYKFNKFTTNFDESILELPEGYEVYE